jgi:hypothetical protein
VKGVSVLVYLTKYNVESVGFIFNKWKVKDQNKLFVVLAGVKTPLFFVPVVMNERLIGLQSPLRRNPRAMENNN